MHLYIIAGTCLHVMDTCLSLIGVIVVDVFVWDGDTAVYGTCLLYTSDAADES